jgi:hypothetical protein
MIKRVQCRDCVFFKHVPFTAGHCWRVFINGRYPRITAERDWPRDDYTRCGPEARHYRRKRSVKREVAA